MSQIDVLLANLDGLSSTIISMGEKINKLSATAPPSLTFSDYNGDGMFKLMTNRQIAKRIIMMGGNQLGLSATNIVNNTVAGTEAAAAVNQYGGPIAASTQNQINTIDENIAHLTVYGKFLYDVNGKLIDNEILYPDCVAADGQGEGGVNHMTESFPLLQWASDVKNEFKLAIAGIRIKAGEIGQAFIDMQFQLILAITTLAASATILPPGSGLPVALSAIKAIPAAFMAFQTRIMQIIPYLKPISFISVLLPMDKIDAAIAPINAVLSMVKAPFAVLDVILSLITALAGATPPVPGVGGEPTQPMLVQPTANPNSVNDILGKTKVDLKSNVSQGSWQYSYAWSSDPYGFIGTKKDVTDYPKVTTKYIVTVTDIKSNERISSSIIVDVVTPS